MQSFFTGYPASIMHNVTTNATRPVTELTHPQTLPELPPNADGSLFDPDTALRDIAEAGRQWRTEYVRKADMECYVYR